MRMSKRLAAGVVGVGVAWSYFSTRHEAMKPLDPSEVSGRIWVESRSKTPTDYVQGLYLAPVVGYGTDELPAFYSRSSGLKLGWRLDTPQQLMERAMANSIDLHAFAQAQAPSPKPQAQAYAS